MGICGSTYSASVHDAILTENLGTPSDLLAAAELSCQSSSFLLYPSQDYRGTCRQAQWPKRATRFLSSHEGGSSLLRMTGSMQASMNSSCREAVAAHIEAWHRNGYGEHIDPELMNVYELLAGNPGPIIQALHLNWIPAFALYFW